jgi:hypothetical protein
MLAAVITLSDDRERPETANEFVTQRSHSAHTLVHLVCNGVVVRRERWRRRDDYERDRRAFLSRVGGSMRLPRAP